MDVMEVAQVLANAHRAEDPATTAVYLASDPRGSEVRLVEVSASVESTGEVLPFRFRSSPEKGVPLESVVVLLSEDEWRRVQAGELHLPDGWGSPEALRPVV
ncbi:MAG: hypothetical protein A2138_09235 [Deltaproteobacteria bacterium RBG_16_71_12]|nr:MAG: hypothetical protein A2138_09235 [Deltaproteobacteria bacterium RBG_16_71_12]